jgi:hypothetical protein
MKKIYQIHVFLIGILILTVGLSSSQAAAFTWNGNVSSAWNTSANWTPAGIPGLGDDVTINASGGGFNPAWDELPGIRNITMSARTLDLNGFALQISGTAVFSGGVVSNGSIVIASASATFSGTTFNVPISYTGARALFNGGIFNNTVTVVKNGGGNDACNGNCTFNGALNITNTDDSQYRFANLSADVYNGVVTYTNTGAGGIYPAFTATGNAYNENIVVNCSGAGGIRFGQNNGTSSQLSGKLISIGTSGFSSGLLVLRYFTQNGNAAHTLTGTGNAFFQTEIGTTINWNLTVAFPNVQIAGTTFTSDLTVNKSSNTQNTWNGGNTFQGTTRINNNGNNNLLMGNLNPDIFNGPLYLDNNATGNFTISLCRGAAGNQINHDLYLNNSATGGIFFGFSGGITTMQSGRTINFFNDGFTNGTLTFSRFTKLGTDATTFTQNSGNAALTIANSSVFNGNVTISFPRLSLNGCNFEGTFDYTKIGTSAATSTGGNIFNGPTSFTNTTTGTITLGDVNSDVFNNTLTISNSGNSVFNIARTGLANQFNGNITINSTGSSQGVRFGQNNGRSVLASGAVLDFATASSGTNVLRGFTQTSAETMNYTFTGNSILQFEINTVLNGALTINAPNVIFNGGVFNNNVIVNRNGTTGSTSNGSTTFNGDFTLNASGNGSITYANTLADVYNGNVTINNTQTSGAVSLCRTGAGNLINGNLILTCTSTGGIGFGSNGGITTMADGRTITLGPAGYTNGALNFRGFVKQGNTGISLSQTTGNATISFLPGSDISGNVSINFPRFILQQTRFRGNVSITKNLTGNDSSPGGCTFDGTLSVTNPTDGQIVFSNAQPDIYGGNITINNSGNTIFYLAHNGSGTQFNGNLIVNSSGTSQGIRLGQSTGTATMGTGNSIQIGGTGFSSGNLFIRNFTQTGATPQTFALTGATSQVYLQTGNIFNGEVTVTAPQVFLNGSRYNSNLTVTCNSTAAFNCNGGNTFMGTTRLVHNGTNNWVMANTSADIFQGTVIATTTNTNGIIYLAQTAAGTQFNGNIEVNSTGTGGGTRIGNGNGTSSIRDGAEIYVGAAGFSSGTLRIRRLTQIGTESQEINLTGTAQLFLETANVFNAAVNFSAPIVFLNGSTFNNVTRITQNGATATYSNGGNTFNGQTFLTLSGNNLWVMGNATADVFNNDLTLWNSGNNVLYLGHNGAGHQINAMVYLNSTGISQGIQFGQGSGSIALGASSGFEIGGNGFTSGSVRLRRVTQNASAVLAISNTAANTAFFLQSGNVFNGTVNVNFNQVYLNGSTFNNTALITQNGTITITSDGGNTFNGTTIISATGTGEFRLANLTADDYNGNVTFRNTSANRLYPAYSTTVRFSGNVSTVGTTGVLSMSPGTGNGRALFDGTGEQTLSADVATPPTIRNLTINKTGGSLTIGRPLTISNNLTLTAGNIVSSATNLLILNDNITVTGVSSSSFVAGPVRKIGNDAFTFPVGKSGVYRPISISAPGNVAHHFTAEYNASGSEAIYSHASKEGTIDHLSTSEFWILDRTNGASNVSVTLSWDGFSGGVENLSTLRVCRWDGSMWRNHGNGGTTGNTAVGTITSSAPITSFSPFTLGSSNPQNPLPVELLTFTATAASNAVNLDWSTASETNNHFYTVERSKDLKSFETVARIEGAGNANHTLYYSTKDENPYQGVSYYRLVQNDFDGKQTIYGPLVVNYMGTTDLTIYPNPFENQLTIGTSEFVNGEQIEIRLFDPIGRIVFQKSVTTSDVNESLNEIPDGPAGIYTLQINQGDIQLSKKIIRK